MDATQTRGSSNAFDANWTRRHEAHYNHWTPGAPANQVQLAFRQHWELFSELLGSRVPGRCLEVGCGRGSMSSYFAANGWDCTLLDTSSAALQVARGAFQQHGHPAQYVAGDALGLPFPDENFDVVVSIGLLEHFEAVKTPLLEQVRVLRPGGTFLGYVVPERPDNVQRWFRWLNQLLALGHRMLPTPQAVGPAKAPVYRSDLGSERYLEVLAGQPIRELWVTGMYPLPLISHSPEFPFSLLPAPAELALTRIFETTLATRRRLRRGHPWTCDEAFGQAFLIKFEKV